MQYASTQEQPLRFAIARLTRLEPNLGARRSHWAESSTKVYVAKAARRQIFWKRLRKSPRTKRLEDHAFL